MDDLISRAEAIRRISKAPFWGTVDGYCALTFDDVESAIKNVPTVDAAPIVHSTWVMEPDGYYLWHCAKCRFTHSVPYKIFRFCPNCGAKMDGEHTEEAVKWDG